MELPDMTDCVPASPPIERLRSLLSQMRNTCDEIEAALLDLGDADETIPELNSIQSESESTFASLEDIADPEEFSVAESDRIELVELVESPNEVPLETDDKVANDDSESLEQPQSDSSEWSLSQDELGDVLESFSSPTEEGQVAEFYEAEEHSAAVATVEPETQIAPESDTINISAMLENREPKGPVVPPAPGGTVLSEDELLAMLAEAESRAEDIDEQCEASESPLTVVMGGGSESASPDSLSPIESNEELVATVPAVLALAALAVPIRKDGETLVLAVAEPIDSVAIENIEKHLGASVTTEPRPMLEVLEMLRGIYKDGKAPVA